MSASTTLSQPNPADVRILRDVLSRLLDVVGPTQIIAYDPELLFEDAVELLRETKRGVPYKTSTFGRIIAAADGLDTFAVHAGRRTPWVFPVDEEVHEQQLLHAATAIVAFYQDELNREGPFYYGSNRLMVREMEYLGHFVCLECNFHGIVDLFGSTLAQSVVAIYGADSGQYFYGRACEIDDSPLSRRRNPLLAEASRRLIRRIRLAAV
jgi:hypothetical protein